MLGSRYWSLQTLIEVVCFAASILTSLIFLSAGVVSQHLQNVRPVYLYCLLDHLYLLGLGVSDLCLGWRLVIPPGARFIKGSRRKAAGDRDLPTIKKSQLAANKSDKARTSLAEEASDQLPVAPYLPPAYFLLYFFHLDKRKLANGRHARRI